MLNTICNLFFVVIFHYSIVSWGGCPVDITPILQGIGSAPAENTAAGNYSTRVWIGHQALASHLYHLFALRQLDAQDLSQLTSCLLKPLNHQDLNLAMNTVFRTKSLQRIESINPQEFSRISKKFKIENIAFQVFDTHVQNQKLAEGILGTRPAGFNMTTQALFMNLAQIESADWDVFFIHELGQYLDPVEDHVKFFNDLKTIAKIVALTKQYDQNNTLLVEDLKLVDEWLVHGLNIALLAEWRVWNFTLDYLSVQPDYVFGPKTSWLKTFLQKTGSERKTAMFSFLDINFENPKDQFFSHPLIQKRIIFLRQWLREKMAKGDFVVSNP